jgi:hypothetical protein
VLLVVPSSILSLTFLRLLQSGRGINNESTPSNPRTSLRRWSFALLSFGLRWRTVERRYYKTYGRYYLSTSFEVKTALGRTPPPSINFLVGSFGFVSVHCGAINSNIIIRTYRLLCLLRVNVSNLLTYHMMYLENDCVGRVKLRVCAPFPEFCRCISIHPHPNSISM